MNTDYFHSARNIFKEVQKAFPHISMQVKFDDPHVDLSMDINKQKGLDFDINVNLQTDELHISTEFIWCQFFPMPAINDIFYDSICGLISGSYRVLQLYKEETIYKAYLQKPTNDGWERVYTHRHKLSFPWTSFNENIIQNGMDSTIKSIFK